MRTHAFLFKIVLSTAASRTGVALGTNWPTGAVCVSYKSEIALTTTTVKNSNATA